MQVPDARACSYLLGLYLGDGASAYRRTYGLRITLDEAYPKIIAETRAEVQLVPRWFFSNRSEDILGLFCVTCERVGVRWTRSSARNVSISQRASVELFEEHVGAKR